MPNPLYSLLNNQSQNNLIQQFMKFRQTFTGDPKAQIQRMLNSGQITQEQYNNAVQMAQQLQKILR